MSHILVVDNHSTHLKKLWWLLDAHRVLFVDYHSLSSLHIDEYDAVILTWGHDFSVENHHDVYQQEIELVKHCSIPLFGICLWFQIICAAYGSHMLWIGEKVKGVFPVEIVKQDMIFDWITWSIIQVAEAHRRSVQQIENLEVLARSDYWIEVIKDPDKLLYWTQFHPELFVDESEWYILLKNFLAHCLSTH